MWKAPYRPGNEVTQSFNSGLVTVYGVTDSAQPGRFPTPELRRKVTLRYEERQLGLRRYYAAKQNQVRVERVLRVPRTGQVSTQDVAVTEDGRQYRVELVQGVREVWPASADLTLAAVEQVYTLPEGTKKAGANAPADG